MAFWDQLKKRTQDMTAQLQGKAAQLKSREFAKGSMAMCAMIAAADGSIDADERRKVASLISSNDVLKMFPAEELQRDFDFYCDKLSNNFEFGKVEAMATISKLKAKQDQARAVVQIGVIIGGADGNFDNDEKRVVRDACFAVGIDPTEFDLAS